MVTSAILSALSTLTKPISEVTVRDAHATQQGALLAALQANQALLEERLQSERGLEEVRRLREEVRAGAPWFCGDTEDPTWSFVQECLLLLLSLARHLTHQLQLFNQTPSPAASAPRLRTPEMAPPLPPDVLSVTQQKELGAALQFAVSLGLCPYLWAGVGVPLGHRSAFGAMVEGVVRQGVAPGPQRRLLTTTTVLLEMAELSSLATLVFTRHLGDVMATLCQLGYRPQRPEGGANKGEKELRVEERRSCREALQSLLGKVYQPIVIKELLVLQGGPKQGSPAWLRRLCGQLLSERLIQPKGVQAVVRAILEGTPGGDSDWRKCDGVARILAACPQQCLSPDAYYRQVCPQVLDLLHFRDKLTAQQFQRVATRAVLTMVQERPQLAQQYLLTPLLSPLLRCGQSTEEGRGQESVEEQELSLCVEEQELSLCVEEQELSLCVEDVYKICVVGNSASGPLLEVLGGALPVLFSLYCFTKHNVSHLRAPCQEILLWFLGQVDPPVALAFLKHLSGLEGEARRGVGGGAGGVAPGFHFTPGSEGGAKLSPRETVSGGDGDDDDDDALYERLSGEQWRLECLVQMLAELKDKDLPGDFFLGLLQELTGWAAEEEEVEQEVDTSAMTLLELEQHLIGRAAGSGQRLALLQVLAVMCEGLPPTLLLRKPTQVVEFIVGMLQRACAGLDQGSGSQGPVETQTLSMGMGLVATLLSAPTELSPEDYSAMSRLLPPLEEITQKHPEVVIQELASDLRTAIATHGACRPDNVTRAAQRQNPLTGNSVPSATSRNTQCRQNSHSDTSPSAVQPFTAHNEHRIHTLQTASTPAPTHTRAPIPDTHTPRPPTPPQTLTPDLRTRDGPPDQNQSQTPHPAQRGAPRPGQEAGAVWRSTPGTGQSVREATHQGGSAGRGGGSSSIDPPSTPAPPNMALSDCLQEACDPDVPTRAVALRTLTRAIRDGHPEALQAQEKVLTLFLENLEHEDTFVYLSAIQGLAVLADSFPERILQRLLGEYQRGPSLSTNQKEQSLETRLKVGEVLMRASRAMGDLAPHLGGPLVGVFLQGTRDEDPTVRASCLSNLGELCHRLHYALGPLAQELSGCLTALVKTEREVEVRRAAVHVIVLLLRGLRDKTTQVLSDVLLDLYRALKWVVRSDSDDVTVLHAQLALEQLDDVMRKFIFPPQKLEKKIVVLP